MLKPYLLIDHENNIVRYTEALGCVMVTSIKYHFADQRDYNIMLRLTQLKELIPRHKLIALEIMK